MKKVIGIGEYDKSSNGIDELETHALGSCVGVVAISKSKGEVALAHVSLPYSSINPKEAKEKPYKYAETVIPYMIQDMKKTFQVAKEDIRFVLYGGAGVLSDKDLFAIGKNNLEVLEKVLRKNHLQYEKCDVGGAVSRTLKVKKGGEVLVRRVPVAILK